MDRFDPEGRAVNVLRTHDGDNDKAALVNVSADGQRLSFDRDGGVIDMPGGGSKFTIRYDTQSARYWSIVNKQTEPAAYRNNLVLASSSDLVDWKVESPLLYHADAQVHAWQYVDWQFEGDDLVFASRTAFDDGLGGAHTAHDANYLTFHRTMNFRRISGPDRLPSWQQLGQPKWHHLTVSPALRGCGSGKEESRQQKTADKGVHTGSSTLTKTHSE